MKPVHIYLLVIIGVIYTAVQRKVMAQTDSSREKAVTEYIYRGTVVDSVDNEPIVNAHVFAISESDTSLTVTYPNGLFHIRSSKPFSSIEIMMMGYRIAHLDIQPGKTSYDFGHIKMSSKAYQLDELIVEARVKKVIHRGDTIQFNAGAFKVSKWANAGELLSKMPGMEVNKKEGIVRFNGEIISVIYVNGKKIFGNDLYSLLTYLDAKDVKTVDAYEEPDDRDAHFGIRTGEKRWVLNFKTFTEIIGMMVGHAQASLGGDEQPGADGTRQSRYSLGTSLNFFKESRGLSLDAFGNDLDRITNKLEEINALSQLQPGYNKIGAFKVKGHLVKRSWEINASYNYERRDNSIITSNQRLYPSIAALNSRVLSSTSNAHDTIHAHNIVVNGVIRPRYLYLSYSLNHSIRKDMTHNLLNNSHVKGDELISEMSNKRRSDTKGYTGYYFVRGTYQLPRITVGLAANTRISNNSGRSMLVDTLMQNVVYSFKEVHYDGDNTNTEVFIYPSLTYHHTPRLGLSADLQMTRNRVTTRNVAIDQYTHTIDSTQTYHYEDNSNSLRPSIRVSYLGKKSRLHASAGWNLQWQNQNDVNQQIYTVPDRLFHAPRLDILYVIENLLKNADKSSLSFAYRNDTQVPGSNMLRPIINYQDPLYLQGGNPNLAPSHSHHLSADLIRIKDSYFSKVSLNFVHRRDHFDANRTIFFDSETVLHEFNDFVAQAGSTLTTFGNIRNQYQLGVDFRHDFPVDAIYGIFKTRMGYTYFDRPRYVNDEIVKTYTHTPSGTIKLESNILDNIDLKITSTSSYSHTNRSNMQRNRIFNQLLQTEINSFFVDDKLSVSLYCSNSFLRNIDYEEANRSVHLLNLHVGYKFLPRQQAEISLSAYDLLNKNESYRSVAYPEYLINTRSQIASRYFMVNFVYQFKAKITEERPTTGYESIIN